jgi:hypothetical protein
MDKFPLLNSVLPVEEGPFFINLLKTASHLI